MKKFVALMLAATFLVAPMAQARDDYRGNDRGRHYDNRDNDRGRHADRDVRPDRKANLHKQRWNKGHRMSSSERRHMREVRDYRRHRLSAPPRGHRWVRVDNDFLLVGITSGIIASIIASR